MLKKLALTDALTGLPNRRAIDRLARQELVRRDRYPNALTLGMIDADNFKEINTRHLYTGGDHVLTWLGQTLGKAVRTVDTVGRVSGEEFIVVAPETDLDGALTLGERIRSTVATAETVYKNEPIRVTVSVGLAVAPVGAVVTYEQLRHAAAAALSEAKAGGRNRCVIRVLPGTPEEGAA
jgi:diguanylate cyclase (GGDEF)-like protein